MTHLKLFVSATFLLAVLAGCQTKNLSETQQFEASIKKDLPFRIDSMRWLDGADQATFQFANNDYVATPPDAEIDGKGALSVYKTFVLEKPSHQEEDIIWRNVVVSKRNRRVICIDRFLKEGKTQGFIYVFQSESPKFPTYSKYHWDVSDPHNIEPMGLALESLRELTAKRLKGDGTNVYEAPTSQDAYWTLIFHADSLYADHLFSEAKQMYDLAFTEDRFILPSQLSTTARKMKAVGNDQAALEYLTHRMEMEKDFYEEPAECSYRQLKDTFELRKSTWGYNLRLKEKLERLFESDQYDRILWLQAANRHPQETKRVEMLASEVMETDSFNLSTIQKILTENGFPSRKEVGEFAVIAVFSVFQHNDLEHQKQFLPQLEEAAQRGDIAPAYVAALKDRIDIREGRPQKYGTQMDGNGKLSPLLDASRVNEWRKEVGLPPIEIK